MITLQNILNVTERARQPDVVLMANTAFRSMYRTKDSALHHRLRSTISHVTDKQKLNLSQAINKTLQPLLIYFSNIMN